VVIGVISRQTLHHVSSVTSVEVVYYVLEHFQIFHVIKIKVIRFYVVGGVRSDHHLIGEWSALADAQVIFGDRYAPIGRPF